MHDSQPSTESVLPQIEAVAFDMDGLTLNTEDLYEEVGTILMQRRGKTYRDEVRGMMMGLPAQKAFQVLIEVEQLSDHWQDLLKESDAIFEELLDHRVEPMPGLVSLLDLLDEINLPRCIATSSRVSFASRALTTAGILDRFDFVLTAEHVNQGKPAPDIYLESARRMRVHPSAMLVLEDSNIGTQAGVAAGGFVVSVPSRHTVGSAFTGAQQIISSLSHPYLRELLTKQ